MIVSELNVGDLLVVWDEWFHIDTKHILIVDIKHNVTWMENKSVGTFVKYITGEKTSYFFTSPDANLLDMGMKRILKHPRKNFEATITFNSDVYHVTT